MTQGYMAMTVLLVWYCPVNTGWHPQAVLLNIR